jgi:single-strand DNA-binding protein
MASDLNQVKIDGRLVDTPKINELGSGARVATLKVANNRYYKGKEDPDWKEKAGFFEVEAWNALADSVANMTKGQPVHIEGALGQNRWTDDEKKQHSRIVIEATKIEVRELKRERSDEREESGMEL